MPNQIQQLLTLLRSERESLQEKISSLVSSCDDLSIRNEDRPTRPLHRTLSLLHLDHRFKMLPSKESTSSGDFTEDLTPETSENPTAFVESQATVGGDMEKLVTEEMAAIKQISAQLNHLERLCGERLLWKEKLRSLQSQLDSSKSTVQCLRRENAKLKTTVIADQAERETLKKKIAELNNSLEKATLKYRKARMTVLASDGRLTMEKRKQETLGKVKRELVDAANQEKLKVVPDRTKSLREAVARKDEAIATYLKEVTELQAQHAVFTKDLREMKHTLKETDWQVSNLQGQLEVSCRENAVLRKEKEELTTQLQELQARYLDTTGCLEVSLTKTDTQLSQARKALHDGRKDFEQQLNQCTQKNLELKAALDHAVQSKEHQKAETTTLRQQIAELKSDLLCEREHSRRMVEASAARCQELAQRACFLELQQTMSSELK